MKIIESAYFILSHLITHFDVRDDLEVFVDALELIEVLGIVGGLTTRMGLSKNIITHL